MKVGWAVTAQDIRERKANELRLRQADQRKDEFLALLAHELRNPLAAIRNSYSTCSTRSEPKAQSMETARAIVTRQVGHMSRLVDDLLDIGRVNSDKVKLQLKNVDVCRVVRDVVEGVAGAGVRVVLLAPDHPVWVSGDAVRLAQVVGNLLSNAFKFSPAGRQVHVSVHWDDAFAIVRVRDEGIGIAPADLGRIFEMFTQVESRPDQPSSGLGLGLPLARRLVQLHGGNLEASSRGIGQGSEFIVRVPLVTQGGTAADIEASPQVPVKTRRYSILIVDDNEDAADSLALLLTLAGHAVSIAYDGAKALELVTAGRPRVVLLDIGLPGMNGYEVCRRLRSLDLGTRPIVIATTGWGQERDKQRSAEAGFDAHLVKPLDADTLERLLAKLIETAVGP